MQDPAAAYQQQMNPQFAEQEQLKCPRCESTNTKFCYYNNYNLSQPRHFCKNCRRYWTKGGSLRNIPVGGGTRKNSKRASNPKRTALSSPSSSSSSSTANPVGKPDSPAATAVYGLPGIAGGSFSSLLSSSGQFGNLFEGLGSHGSTVQLGNFGENANLEPPESNLIRNPEMMKLQSNDGENPGVEGGFLGLQSGEDSSCWGGGNGWPHDLAIYTPGSNFQ